MICIKCEHETPYPFILHDPEYLGHCLDCIPKAKRDAILAALIARLPDETVSEIAAEARSEAV